ncbi:4-(cytidine 5'-diphospho)-2-C-methyl-D-erythritol kinase [Kyrpidia sp.]|uniref:4-(cytidine 5'-diphospho)-2-C-methyl-D-erythritol kinase n=1 Tax=Kyrpidia sp. TaxID=2073077 RepID=UPI002585B27C|nr:4-(cytidine 5'-diphospho)-2-C-methyl-D-erythritol kinase [Kyrpidia sp.]MCL6577566.1 4-(cytidine 5'-diphospho)-2-C-methyl-D-erythritol kinase [Kyrpidia sp.]
MVCEKAPAKINLSLDVLYRRDDGYHEVEMVMQTVDLADRVYLEEAEDLQLSCTHPKLPTDERNLALRAAKLLQQETGCHRGASIHLDKRIPLSAGLAGGSSDAAAVLRGLNRLWGLGLTKDALAELGAKLGSDVPFCVYGGTALAQGRGERITILPSCPPAWVILVHPPIPVSTAAVYGRLRLDEVTEHPKTAQMVEAIREKDLGGISQRLGNVLETVTFDLYPEVRRLKARMIQFGALGALMSGSGPTVFGLVDRQSKAERIHHAFRGFVREVYLTRVCGLNDDIVGKRREPHGCDRPHGRERFR